MLRNVFQTVDMDNNGMLDIDEFVEVRTHERGVATSAPAKLRSWSCSLQAMKMVEGNTLSDAAARMLFIQNIKDRDEGLVDMANFIDIAQSHNLQFNVELIRKQHQVSMQGEDDISKEALESMSAAVRCTGEHGVGGICIAS